MSKQFQVTTTMTDVNLNKELATTTNINITLTFGMDMYQLTAALSGVHTKCVPESWTIPGFLLHAQCRSISKSDAIALGCCHGNGCGASPGAHSGMETKRTTQGQKPRKALTRA